jgi:hypothetical protein
VRRLVLVYWIEYIARRSVVPALRAIHSPKFFAAVTDFTWRLRIAECKGMRSCAEPSPWLMRASLSVYFFRTLSGKRNSSIQRGLTATGARGKNGILQCRILYWRTFQ